MIHIASFWHTLVVKYGLWHLIVGWTVGFLMGTVVLGGILRPAYRRLKKRVKQAFNEHLALQQSIVSELDTTTPGGLHEVVKALHANKAAMEQLADKQPEANK